jgi:hypothetical protein
MNRPSVPQAELRDPRLAGIAEPALVAGIGDAPGIVGVVGDRVAVGVGDRDDRALLVGVEVVAHEPARIFVPDERLVGARAALIGAKKRARAVIFLDQPVAVVEEAGRARRGARHLPEAAERIVGERRVLRTGG